jgi:imidazolonepropionase-like amidohydrolase
MSTAGVLHLGGHVLVGPDEEVGEAWVLGGRITFEAPRHGGEVTEVAGWVIPGLVDAHSHIGLDAHGGTDRPTAEAQALTDLAAGTMLIRDAGSPIDTHWIDDREDLPKIVRAGKHIARTARYIRGISHEIEPEDLAAYMAAEAALGDGWVKIVGDWIDREVGDLAPCWPAEVLRPAMEAAHAAGARVTAHCFGEDCLADLIEAGIDCIEHASGLTSQTISMAAARGVAIVPTLINIDNFPRFAAAGEARFPTYANHMRRLHAQRHATIGAAFDAGLPIFVGTDAGSAMPHGQIADEIAGLVAAGIPATTVLDGACWGARSWLDRPSLAEGEDADLLVFDADPRADVAVLLRPRMRVLRGRTVG